MNLTRYYYPSCRFSRVPTLLQLQAFLGLVYIGSEHVAKYIYQVRWRCRAGCLSSRSAHPTRRGWNWRRHSAGLWEAPKGCRGSYKLILRYRSDAATCHGAIAASSWIRSMSPRCNTSKRPPRNSHSILVAFDQLSDKRKRINGGQCNASQWTGQRNQFDPIPYLAPQIRYRVSCENLFLQPLLIAII